MLVGKKIILRTVRESDLPKLYELRADIRNLGEDYPLHMISELLDKKRFSESGWWEPDLGVLLSVDPSGNILGQVNFYKASPVLNAYEIGYRIYTAHGHKLRFSAGHSEGVV
jgi:RimJ/RimL family protein N-acetyltransferase